MNANKIKTLSQSALTEQKLQEIRNRLRYAKNPRTLKEVSEDFEALFVYFLLRSMRKTIMKSGLLDAGLQGEVMEGLLDQELSRVIARNTRLGIAEMLQKQLQQKAGSSPTATQSYPISGLAQYRKASIAQIPDPSVLEPFEPFIQQVAQQNSLDANLIRAVILCESSGNPRAISGKGAKGLMQLMDATSLRFGVTNPFDPEQNILAGTAYLAELMQEFRGNLPLVLAAYNAGPQTVKRFQGIPPFPETRRYVQRVLSLYRMLMNNSTRQNPLAIR